MLWGRVIQWNAIADDTHFLESSGDYIGAFKSIVLQAAYVLF